MNQFESKVIHLQPKTGVFKGNMLTAGDASLFEDQINEILQQGWQLITVIPCIVNSITIGGFAFFQRNKN